MTATPLVQQSDVEAALLRPLTSTEASYIDAIIAQASALLRTAAPSVDARMAAFAVNPTDPTALDPEVVSTVLAGVIKRYLINPTGIASTSNTVGPYSQSVSYALRSEKDTRGVLQVTSDDLAVLFPSRKRLRAGMIRTRPGLAPRPVGNYGPLPTIDSALDAVITYDPDLLDDLSL